MKLKEFYYNLPRELVAQYPAERRDESRIMILKKNAQSIEHKKFSALPAYLDKGDCVVVNNTKVIPARTFGRRRTGGKVEIFILDKSLSPAAALIRPSGRVKDGEVITLESGDWIRVLGKAGTGRFIEFDKPLDGILARAGHVPLPPYISRPEEPSDKDRYQTVFSSREGSTASPTAGLHFTEEVINKLKKNGVDIAYVTLHSSYGTFAPIMEEDIEKHKMHREYFELPVEAQEKIRRAKKDKKKVYAVGTTSARVLESNFGRLSTMNRELTNITGWTDLFIYPGYKFKIVDALLTNFHFPKSTLLLLASAFAGREFLLRSYKEAIKQKYRFFSYGDCMLIL